MCVQSKCSTCGKTSWAGCGKHVALVYGRIPEGQHCHCKEWPGIVMKMPEKVTGTGTEAADAITDHETKASS